MALSFLTLPNRIRSYTLTTSFYLVYGRVPFYGENIFLCRGMAVEEVYLSRKRLKPVGVESSLQPSSHDDQCEVTNNNSRPMQIEQQDG